MNSIPYAILAVILFGVGFTYEPTNAVVHIVSILGFWGLMGVKPGQTNMMISIALTYIGLLYLYELTRSEDTTNSFVDPCYKPWDSLLCMFIHTGDFAAIAYVLLLLWGLASLITVS